VAESDVTGMCNDITTWLTEKALHQVSSIYTNKSSLMETN